MSTENPRDATGHYTNWEGQRCVIRLWNRTPTVPPAAGTLNADGTRFTGSGSGSRSLDFTDWCTYTLHVDSGIVTAGEAGEETAA